MSSMRRPVTGADLTYRADLDKRTFFDDQIVPKQRYGEGVSASTTRFQGTHSYLKNHPAVRGHVPSSLEEWPVYSTYTDHGMRHMDANPTFKSSMGPMTDIGQTQPIGNHAVFRTGWKSIRSEGQIKPYAQREAAREHKEKVNTQIAEKRRDMLSIWNNYNGFNPLKNEDLLDRSKELKWGPSTDNSWLHQQMTRKRRAVLPSRDLPEAKVQQMQTSLKNRQEMMQREGKDWQQRTQPTMWSIMHWES